MEKGNNRNNIQQIRNSKNQGKPEGIGRNKFTMKMQKKLVVLFLIVLLAFAGLSGRLFIINRDDGEDYKKQVLSQQSSSTNTTIPYKRGEILDAKGTQLAVSEKVYNVILDCKAMNQKEEYVEPTLAALDQCFDIDVDAVRKYSQENPNSQYYVLAKRLPYDQISQFQELKKAAQEEKDEEGNPKELLIQGVWFEEEYKRYYPNNELASDVIGFTTTDGKDGSYGLEEYYNDILSGTNGRTYSYLDSDGSTKRTTKAAVDGYNIHSTIDVTIQGIVEKYLKQFNEQYKDAYREGNGAKNVGCIIMDVHTGNILAMADYPNFDLNNTRSTDPLIGLDLLDAEGKQTGEMINVENVESLEGDQLLQNLNSLWKNFTINATYEPGSTMKPFVAAAGLESGKLTGNESYDCQGFLMIGGHRIRCHTRAGDGILTIEQAIERSCNVALMQMAEQMGEDVFLDYMQKFNFGLKTNVDLAGEARTASLVFNSDTMGVTELATSSFGQGFNTTMIQVITAFSALVNGGYYYEPHLVSKITASDGSVVENIEPRLLKQVISNSTSEQVQEYLKAVVVGEKGTGKTARPAGYMISGKTGTAEMVPRDKENYVVSFLGAAPADDPQIAIYVVVDRPNTDRQDDAKFATRIVRGILTEVLPYLNIFMTEPLTDEERAELEALDIEIKQQLVSGNDVSGNDISGNGVSGNGTDVSSGTENQENTDTNEDQEFPNMTQDPTTGKWYDDEGVEVDPDTGEAVNPGEGDANLPSSPILGEGQQTVTVIPGEEGDAQNAGEADAGNTPEADNPESAGENPDASSQPQNSGQEGAQ